MAMMKMTVLTAGTRTVLTRLSKSKSEGAAVRLSWSDSDWAVG